MRRVSLNLTRVTPELCLFDEIVVAYANDPEYADIIAYLRTASDVALGTFSRTKQDQIQRYLYSIDQFDAPRTAVANDVDLRARIIHEFHDAPIGGPLGRKKTFADVSQGTLASSFSSTSPSSGWFWMKILRF